MSCNMASPSSPVSNRQCQNRTSGFVFASLKRPAVNQTIYDVNPRQSSSKSMNGRILESEQGGGKRLPTIPTTGRPNSDDPTPGDDYSDESTSND